MSARPFALDTTSAMSWRRGLLEFKMDLQHLKDNRSRRRGQLVKVFDSAASKPLPVLTRSASSSYIRDLSHTCAASRLDVAGSPGLDQEEAARLSPPTPPPLPRSSTSPASRRTGGCGVGLPVARPPLPGACPCSDSESETDPDMPDLVGVPFASRTPSYAGSPAHSSRGTRMKRSLNSSQVCRGDAGGLPGDGGAGGPCRTLSRSGSSSSSDSGSVKSGGSQSSLASSPRGGSTGGMSLGSCWGSNALRQALREVNR